MYNKLFLKRKTTSIISIVFCLIVLYGCSSRNTGTALHDNAGIVSSDPEGVNIVLDGMKSNHAVEEILPYVDLVVDATITGIQPARWNTTDGSKPMDWTFEKFTESRIYTPYQFQVIETIKGSLEPGATSSFAVIGGTVGSDTIDAKEGADIYGDIQVGDRAILFLKSTTDSMAYVSPYSYGDVLRLDNGKAVAGCNGQRAKEQCRNVFDAKEIKDKAKHK